MRLASAAEVRGGRGRRPPREGGGARALRRVPRRARAAGRRRGDGDGRRRHALGRGPAAHGRRRRSGRSAPTGRSACAATSAAGAAAARRSTRGGSSSRTPSTRRRSARTSCASSRSCPGSRWRPGATRSPSAALPRGRTTYRVTLSSGIADAFGQALEPGGALAFAVGPAPAALFAPGGDFVVLDPAGGPRFPVHSVNHASLRVEAYAVGPEDWPAWQAYRQGGWRDEAATPPGRRVIDTTVRVGGEPDALTETRLDLAPALDGGLGQVVLVVRPASPSKERRREAVRAWVQATRIGLDAFADQETLVAWASDLADGRPLGDVEVALARGSAGRGRPAARTDASGLARLALGEAPAPLLVARRGKDVAILPSQTGWWGEGAGWRKAARTDALRFFVFDDRKMYRPGEEVRVKGWLRRVGAGPRGDVEALPAAVSGLAWTLRDSQGNEVGEGRGPRGRPRRLRPRAEAARDDEPRARPCSSSRPRARRSPGAARPRLRGAGVPPARVRGEGAGERGAAPRRRRRHRHGHRRLLRGRGPARRGGELARRARRRATSARRTATTSSSARSCPGGSRRPGRGGAGARGDDDAPAPTARASTACGSTSTAAIRRGRASSAPRPRSWT